MSLKNLGIYLAEITLKSSKEKQMEIRNEVHEQVQKKINEIITEDGREHSYNQAKKKESPAPDSPTTTLSKGWTVILDSACYRIFLLQSGHVSMANKAPNLP